MGVILIAFEREAELSALDQLLSGRGHRVVRSGNGLAALDAARREPPHAIVSDIVLPRMDGFALCRKWKQDERLQAIPFLVLHASPRRSEVRALRAGAGRRALPRALRAAGDAAHGARRAAGERGESERRNGSNTTPLPTLDETVIQRTVGAGESAARCGSRAGAAHRRARESAAAQVTPRSWRSAQRASRSWRRREHARRARKTRSASRPKRPSAPSRRRRDCSRRSKNSKRPIGAWLPAKRASAACSKRIRCRCGSRITPPAASSRSTKLRSRSTVIAARNSSASRPPRSKQPTPKTAPRRSRTSARTARLSGRARLARNRIRRPQLPISFRATT